MQRATFTFYLLGGTATKLHYKAVSSLVQKNRNRKTNFAVFERRV